MLTQVFYTNSEVESGLVLAAEAAKTSAGKLSLARSAVRAAEVERAAERKPLLERVEAKSAALMVNVSNLSTTNAAIDTLLNQTLLNVTAQATFSAQAATNMDQVRTALVRYSALQLQALAHQLPQAFGGGNANARAP